MSGCAAKTGETRRKRRIRTPKPPAPFPKRKREPTISRSFPDRPSLPTPLPPGEGRPLIRRLFLRHDQDLFILSAAKNLLRGLRFVILRPRRVGWEEASAGRG